MIKKTKTLIFFLSVTLLFSCSLTKNKLGIWDGDDNEKFRLAKIRKDENDTKKLLKIYSSEYIYKKEIPPTKSIILSNPKTNNSWVMSGANLQNSTGNIFLSGITNNFLKKKIGKNKFAISKASMEPLIINDQIILTDDVGTIFNIYQNGKVKWKKNIYKKMYKKIYKNLSISIYKNNIYVADNIGFIYSISLETGEILWIKNHGIPIKSRLKIFDNKIFFINQDNRIFSISTDKGTKIWNIRSIPSFIKLQNFLTLAISKSGDLVALNSAGDLFKIKAKTGQIYWTLNTIGSTLVNDTDFFKSSDIVISGKDIFFSSASTFFSLNLENGYLNWKHDISFKNRPIVDKNNIFLLTDNGYFLSVDKKTGKIIWSINILKSLKQSKQMTKISGFILGSNKIYVVTRNGYIIVCSAESGNIEYVEKITGFAGRGLKIDTIETSPVISNGSLYIVTTNSRLFGFN